MKLVLAGSAYLTLGLGLSMGCSDPPAQPAQGAASIWFQPRPGTGGSCLVSAAPVTVPASADTYLNKCSPETAACTPTKKVAVDGDGADVSCSIRKSGDGYAVSASLADPDVGFSFTMQTISPIPATGGSVTVSGQKAFGEIILKDNACTLTILALDTGSIWGTYNCPAMGEEQSPQPICTASGSFAFENCDS